MKKRPDASTCTNLELGAIRSLMKDHREEIDGKLAKDLCAAMCAEASA